MQSDLMLITFLEDCYYDASNGFSDYVPKGTRLIGEWDIKQTEDTSVCTFIVNGVTWNLEKDQVRTTDWDRTLTQEQIANTDESQANLQDEQKDWASAQVLYARAIIEFEATGWTESRLATLRMKRAGALLELKQDNDAAEELERAGRAFEEQAQNPYNRMVSGHLDYAEHAVDALIPLATVYLRRIHDTVRARQVIERLLTLNSLIKKRYERKVDLLLYIVEFWLDLGERDQALSYFEQANRFYSQQLAHMEDFFTVAPIAAHLKKVKVRLQDVRQSQTIRFSITTKTPDELEAILALLQESQRGLEVTKGITSQRMSKDARTGLVYVANLRIVHHAKKATGPSDPEQVKIQDILKKIRQAGVLSAAETEVLFDHLNDLAQRNWD